MASQGREGLPACRARRGGIIIQFRFFTLSPTGNLASGFSDHIFCKSLHGTVVFYPFFNSRIGSEIKFWLGAKVVLDVVSHFELT